MEVARGTVELIFDHCYCKAFRGGRGSIFLTTSSRSMFWLITKSGRRPHHATVTPLAVCCCDTVLCSSGKYCNYQYNSSRDTSHMNMKTHTHPHTHTHTHTSKRTIRAPGRSARQVKTRTINRHRGEPVGLITSSTHLPPPHVPTRHPHSQSPLS